MKRKVISYKLMQKINIEKEYGLWDDLLIWYLKYYGKEEYTAKEFYDTKFEILSINEEEYGDYITFGWIMLNIPELRIPKIISRYLKMNKNDYEDFGFRLVSISEMRTPYIINKYLKMNKYNEDALHGCLVEIPQMRTSKIINKYLKMNTGTSKLERNNLKFLIKEFPEMRTQKIIYEYIKREIIFG